MNTLIASAAPSSAHERPSLPAQVARHLLSLIAKEHLRPGDLVPSEIKIGRDLEVSRGSVREAYRTLAALGILVIEPGRRPRLRAIDAQFLTQVFDYALETSQVTHLHVLETRRAIEIQSAQLAARHATHAQREELVKLAGELRAEMKVPERRVAADMAIHRVIAQASGNPLTTLLLDALRVPAKEAANAHYESSTESDLVRLIDTHDAVVDRIRAQDPVGAASAMSYHFDLATVYVQGVAT